MPSLRPYHKTKVDLRHYKRLFGYLKGTKFLIVILFACMILEALLTVGSVSMVKPIVDLLVSRRLVDTRKLTDTAVFELSIPKSFADGTRAIKGAGKLTGHKAGDTLRRAVSDSQNTTHTRFILDLAGTDAFDEGAWTEMFHAKLTAGQRVAETIIIIPGTIQTPAELATGTPQFRLLTSSSPELAQLRTQYLDAIPPPKTDALKQVGFIQKVRAKVINLLLPLLREIEVYSEQSMFHVLVALVVIMLVFAILLLICTVTTGYLSAYLGSLVVRRLRDHVFDHMTKLDLGLYVRQSVGNLMSVVMQDVGTVESAIEILFSSVVKTPITVLTIVITMFMVSTKLTLFCFLVVPVIVLIVFVIGRRVRRIAGQMQAKRAELMSLGVEVFTGMKVVKAYNMEAEESRKFQKKHRSIFRMNLKTKLSEELGEGLTGFLGFLTVAGVILAGGYFILDSGELSGSGFAMFLALLTQIFRPLKSVPKTNSRIQKGLAGCERVFRVLDQKPSIVDAPDAVTLAPLKREIAFENVSFAYSPQGDKVLNDISFRVAAGQAIAFVGETGAGKSTLVNLLPRFFDPTEGRITLDGVDLRKGTVRSLRDQIAVITQEVVLFDDTIANNIAYGCANATREQIIQAATAANAHKFITEKLENGYDTGVGARGARLSGGERQRIAIARALLKNAPILILDEATSSLDSETESLIQEALDRAFQGRTVFVIAHRLSTVHHCDRIYVLDGGQFVEQGTHHELLALGGRYARYNSIQFGKPAPATA
ncbi:MAG: ABC transporter ATP-binding protein/permease [Candidatus Sumerlaeaceae bacterium]|nr:ABC transporter ATP-binding protein/permease [Candidatus Sumerlaeaceae bacterium]